MKINIFLPGLPITPGGGYKIMYEYANQFVKLGRDIVTGKQIGRAHV